MLHQLSCTSSLECPQCLDLMSSTNGFVRRASCPEHLYERLGALILTQTVRTDGGALVVRCLRREHPERRWVTSSLKLLFVYDRVELPPETSPATPSEEFTTGQRKTAVELSGISGVYTWRLSGTSGKPPRLGFEPWHDHVCRRSEHLVGAQRLAKFPEYLPSLSSELARRP